MQQDVEINVPCSGPEFQTNKEYFRASSMGLSTDMSIAKKKAMTEARAEIATAINAKVKSVTDSYVSSPASSRETNTLYLPSGVFMVFSQITRVPLNSCSTTVRVND